MKSQRALRALGYAAFAALSMLICLYLTFPGEAVGARLAHEINVASGGEVTATFGSVGLYRLTGVEAEDVRVKIHKTDPPTPVTIDELQVRLQILPLVLLNLVVSADLEMGDGNIAATVNPNDDGAIAFDLELDGLDVSSPPILGSLIGFPISGTVAGSAEMRIYNEVRKTTGDASLTLHDVGVGPGEPVPGFSLPTRIGFGQLDLALNVQGGRLRLAHFQQTAEKPEMQIRSATASANLRQRVSTTSYDACIELKLDEDFVAKNKKFDAIMDLVQLAPPVGPGLRKDGDGFLHASLSGSFSGRPKTKRRLCTKGSSASRPPPRPGARRPGRPNRGSKSATDDDE